MLRHREIACQRRTAESTEINRDNDVIRQLQSLRNDTRPFNLNPVALTVIETQAIDLESLLEGNGGGRRRVHPAAKKRNRFRLAVHHLTPFAAGFRVAPPNPTGASRLA